MDQCPQGPPSYVMPQVQTQPSRFKPRRHQFHHQGPQSTQCPPVMSLHTTLFAGCVVCEYLGFPCGLEHHPMATDDGMLTTSYISPEPPMDCQGEVDGSMGKMPVMDMPAYVATSDAVSVASNAMYSNEYLGMAGPPMLLGTAGAASGQTSSGGGLQNYMDMLLQTELKERVMLENMRTAIGASSQFPSMGSPVVSPMAGMNHTSLSPIEQTSAYTSQNYSNGTMTSMYSSAAGLPCYGAGISDDACSNREYSSPERSNSSSTNSTGVIGYGI